MGFDHAMDKHLQTDNFNFELRVTIVNKIFPEYLLENIINYEADDFSDKPLGWSRCASVEELKKYGFISTDGSDVTIRLLARRENYSLESNDLKNYNKYLERQLKEQQVSKVSKINVGK